VNDQGISVGPLQDRILLSGQMIGGPGVGKREAVRDVEVVLILLAA
jgi:hypothetical protein